MNLCDAYVAKVLGPPVLKYGKWFLPVSYWSWSIHPQETDLMFNTKEEAFNVGPNYHFLA